MKKKKKSLWVWLVGVLFLICFAFLLVYLTFKKPEVSSIDAKILSFAGTDTLPVSIKLRFYNPNFFDFTYDSINYKVEVDNKLKGFGEVEGAGVIPSKGNKEIKFPLKVLFGPEHSPKGDSGAFKFHINFRTHMGPVQFPIKLTIRKTLPVFKKISIKLDSLIINSFKLKKTDLSAVVKLTNSNQIEFNSKEMSYEFLIDNELIANGNSGIDRILKPKSSLNLNLPIQLNSGKFLKYMVLSRKKNENRPYRLTFHFTLVRKGGGPSEKVIHLEVERKGVLGELQQGFGKENTSKIKFK